MTVSHVAASADANLEHVQFERRSWIASGMAIVSLIAAVKLALHLLTAGRYGYFGDELYYMACSQHLDWGYVDQPPLIAALVWAVRHTLGDSLWALRSLAALAGAANVVLTGMLARELGGRRFAVALAALATACGGVYFVMNYLMTMNAFEPLLWMGCAYIVIRIIKTGNQILWLWFGLLSGIGLQNKYSMLIFGFGITLGLLLTPQRKAFASKWIWIGGAIALAIFLPNIIWNMQHHWPFIELMRNIKASGRDVELGPIGYFLRQIFLMNPVLFPIWAAGILWLLFMRDGKPYRVLGWAFVVTYAVLVLFRGKDYYLAPAFPMMFAAGAIVIDNVVNRIRRPWIKPAYVAIVLVGTLVLMPLVIPVLSVENFLRYQQKLPFQLPASEKAHLRAALPHHFAWQFGWPEMVEAVARAYNSLPPAERAKTAIFGNDFAEAGAIDLFGPSYGLPKAIGGHQSYWLWGPRDYTGEIMIVLGDRPESLRQHCNQVDVVAELNNPYSAAWERKPVLICRGLKYDLKQVWPRLKSWD